MRRGESRREMKEDPAQEAAPSNIAEYLNSLLTSEEVATGGSSLASLLSLSQTCRDAEGTEHA